MTKLNRLFVEDRDNTLWMVQFTKEKGQIADTRNSVDEKEVFEDGCPVFCLLNISIKDFVKKKLGFKHYRLETKEARELGLEPGGVYEFFR